MFGRGWFHHWPFTTQRLELFPWTGCTAQRSSDWQQSAPEQRKSGRKARGVWESFESKLMNCLLFSIDFEKISNEWFPDTKKRLNWLKGHNWQLGCRWRWNKSMMGIVSGRKTLQCQINVHDTTSRQSLWRYPKWAFHATALARWKWFLFPYSDCWTNLVKSSNVMKVHVWQFERVWSFGLGHCEPWRLRFCRHVSVRSIILKGVFFGKSLLSTKSQRMAFDTAFIGFDSLWNAMFRDGYPMVVDEKLQPEALLAPRSSKSLGLRVELQKLKVWKHNLTHCPVNLWTYIYITINWKEMRFVPPFEVPLKAAAIWPWTRAVVSFVWWKTKPWHKRFGWVRDGACKMPQLLGANCPQNIENVIPETQIRMSQDFC